MRLCLSFSVEMSQTPVKNSGKTQRYPIFESLYLFPCFLLPTSILSPHAHTTSHEDITFTYSLSPSFPVHPLRPVTQRFYLYLFPPTSSLPHHINQRHGLKDITWLPSFLSTLILVTQRPLPISFHTLLTNYAKVLRLPTPCHISFLPTFRSFTQR